MVLWPLICKLCIALFFLESNMEEAVVLIVKAPNQQIDDQTIDCLGNWTVRTLKDHLSEVYPSKPVR